MPNEVKSTLDRIEELTLRLSNLDDVLQMLVGIFGEKDGVRFSDEIVEGVLVTCSNTLKSTVKDLDDIWKTMWSERPSENE